jgi:putative ABC transport system ATP-binding protein
LIPNLKAVENVMLPMEFAGVPKAERRSRAVELLDQVGVTGEKQNRRPSRLSGGEQQRVAIARALANKPRVILADEPTGNLDTKTGKVIFSMLKDLSRSANTTVIIVTHDMNYAEKTDVTFRLEDGHLVA